VGIVEGALLGLVDGTIKGLSVSKSERIEDGSTLGTDDGIIEGS